MRSNPFYPILESLSASFYSVKFPFINYSYRFVKSNLLFTGLLYVLIVSSFTIIPEKMMAQCNSVVNGDFAAGASNYSYITSWSFTSGYAYNFQDASTNAYFRQNVTGLNATPVANQVDLTFDVFAQNAGSTSGSSSATLVISLGGTVYLTITNPTGAGAVTATTSNGATLSNWTDMPSPNSMTTRTGVKISIPWVSKPNTADLDFSMTSSSVGDDFGVDNISIDGPCPNPPCPCASGTSCTAGVYANSATAFAAYDAQAISQDLSPFYLRLDGASKAYTFCYTYTTGPTETRVAIRHLATAPSTCIGAATIAYSVCSGSATFVGANVDGGTRNFQYYNVTPNTTYRFCRTLTFPGGTPCAVAAAGTSAPIVGTQAWYIYNASPPPATFTFNCGSATTTGTFTANGVGGQTGSITVPIASATAGSATFTVSASGFSGSLGTVLTAGQTSVTIPITYNGTGVGGSRTLTVTSSQGSGSCTKSVTVVTPATSFKYAYSCINSTVQGNYIANGATGQVGTVTVPINVIFTGSTTFTVSGTGFSGSLTATLTSTTSYVTIPITYDGSGTEGSRTLTITSAHGTGTCSAQAIIQAACQAQGGRIGQ